MLLFSSTPLWYIVIRMTVSWNYKKVYPYVHYTMLQAKLVSESLRESLLADQKAVEESSYSVSGILSSSHLQSTSRIANLQELLEGNVKYNLYKFFIRLESFV